MESSESEVQASMRGQRALAAIVVTDAVGFSARMSVDEESALNIIQRDLQLLADLCQRHQGQVLKSTGDGLLMSFVSAVQAVACALEMQKMLAELINTLPADNVLQHRIGIHLGDVLFQQSDVFGNGVNIAARLEAEAEPGGICISQIVYDVVKARLDLNATFLGPLNLKNIKEAVSAYQLYPLPKPNDLPISSASKEKTQNTAYNRQKLLEDVIQVFEEHPKNLRIKKLIFSACQNTWENNPNVLAEFQIKDLIKTLLHFYPTLEDLQASLKRIVAMLNRKTEYAAIVQTILDQLKKLYTNQPDSTKIFASYSDAFGLNTPHHIYQHIADNLDSHSKKSRIKKLLYCICYRSWENNPEVLAQFESQDLIQQLHQLAPNPKHLNYHLNRIIKRLNRKTEYRQVAQIIVEEFQILYSDDHTSTQIFSNPGMEWEAVHTQANPSVETVYSQNPDHTSFSFSDEFTSYGTQAISAPPPPLISDISSQASEKAVKDRSDLFELRLEIMKYTNPLRAKILLFSGLYSPFTFSRQDWLALKSKTLEDLLREFFEYCQTVSDLESKLTIISHCLENSDENEQVLKALLQAMKPYYPPASTPLSSPRSIHVGSPKSHANTRQELTEFSTT
ncbi:MAG: adenylate/guanylate cyclase domain-containing protein [Leptolyngbyaceae cyanobacterium MO_188.B28]|nr:adenylate/guanylate cyclase domain-containing protein [Leptolyngbyaceae cyanobacterium MO_188.B28]